MKTLIALLALATAIMVSANAHAAGHKAHAKAHTHMQARAQQTFGASPAAFPMAVQRNVYAQPARGCVNCVRRHSSNPAYDVYRLNGDYAGSDPDPRIRSQLFWDDPDADP